MSPPKSFFSVVSLSSSWGRFPIKGTCQRKSNLHKHPPSGGAYADCFFFRGDFPNYIWPPPFGGWSNVIWREKKSDHHPQLRWGWFFVGVTIPTFWGWSGEIVPKGQAIVYTWMKYYVLLLISNFLCTTTSTHTQNKGENLTNQSFPPFIHRWNRKKSLEKTMQSVQNRLCWVHYGRFIYLWRKRKNMKNYVP